MALRAHSKSALLNASCLSFPQLTTTLNWLAGCRMGHMVVTGASHNASDRKQQHGSVSQRKTKFVQLMLSFSRFLDLLSVGWSGWLLSAAPGSQKQLFCTTTCVKRFWEVCLGINWMTEQTHLMFAAAIVTDLSCVFSLHVVFMLPFCYLILQPCFLAIECF